ncbi:MAG TPA: Lrp/AsnC family transcriptional regulator [Thermoleophilaceae bacterium]|nr:Lrp/AsnC family transcriptional regulator [Thermoleophilaceae bacterium]
MNDLGELDLVDRALLRELQKDARQTNKALAEKVGVAPSTCLERIRELRVRGVITGFRAEVDPAAIGRPMEAILSVQQRGSHRQATEQLLEDGAGLPETVRVMALTGTTDFIIHVAVRDMNHLRDLVWGLIERPEVGRVQSSLVFARAEGPGLEPLDSARRSPPDSVRRPPRRAGARS